MRLAVAEAAGRRLPAWLRCGGWSLAAGVAAAWMADDALAQTPVVLQTPGGLEAQIRQGTVRFGQFFALLRNVLIYGSSTALACVVGAAFATGRWNNRWFLTICGGLVVLALCGVFVDFFVDIDQRVAPSGMPGGLLR